MTIAHGVDLVEHDLFARLMAQEDAFLKRCFTEDEIAVGKADTESVQWFASRFASKEAVMKALGTGWTQGVSWHEIVTSAAPAGGLTIRLGGQTALIAEQKHLRRWLLSISHTKHFSIASVIAMNDDCT